MTSSGEAVMDDIVKKLPKKPTEYNLAFIDTAAEVEEGDLWWLRAEKEKLIEVGFNVDQFSICQVPLLLDRFTKLNLA